MCIYIYIYMCVCVCVRVSVSVFVCVCMCVYFSLWPKNNIFQPYLRLSSLIQVSFPVSVRLFSFFSLIPCTDLNVHLPHTTTKKHERLKTSQDSKVTSSFFCRWQEVMADGRGGVGGIHSYSQSPTVRLQSHLLSLWALFLDLARGASQPLNMVLLWPDWACFLTPPTAPSSGDPYQWHKHK